MKCSNSRTISHAFTSSSSLKEGPASGRQLLAIQCLRLRSAPSMDARRRALAGIASQFHCGGGFGSERFPRVEPVKPETPSCFRSVSTQPTPRTRMTVSYGFFPCSFHVRTSSLYIIIKRSADVTIEFGSAT